MKYYSIHFGSVERLKYIMDRVFRLLNRNGIYDVTSSKPCEYRYDLIIDDRLTFVCVIRTGIGVIQGIELLGSYSDIEDPWLIYNWIMDKYSYVLSLKNIDRTNNFFTYPQIKKVIFNDPATIVFWNDGSKTVVKCQEGEVFDKEKGLAMAIVKRYFGNKGNYNNIFRKWCKEERPKDLVDNVIEAVLGGKE